MWYFTGVPIIPANRIWFPAVFFFICLSFLFMVLRMYSRIFLTRKVWWDDGLMTIAMILSISYIGTIIEQLKLGLGDTVAPEDAAQFTHSVYWSILIYSWNQWVIKMSIAAQYYRIFTTAKPRRILRWILLWLGIYGVVDCITPIFMCTPISRFWDRTIDGHCMNYFILHYVLSAINVANDVLVLIFPLPIINKLKLPVRVKTILAITFACGLFATVVSVLRFQALVIFASGGPEDGATLDVPISIWSCLEMSVAIMCGSVSAIKPLFALFIPHLDVLSSGKTSSKSRRTQTSQSWIQLNDYPNREADSRGIEGGGVWVEQSVEVTSTVYKRESRNDLMVSRQ